MTNLLACVHCLRTNNGCESNARMCIAAVVEYGHLRVLQQEMGKRKRCDWNESTYEDAKECYIEAIKCYVINNTVSVPSIVQNKAYQLSDE